MKLALKSRVTKKPGRPKNKCRGVVHDIVSSHAFNVAVVILICLNICLLCITTDGDEALQQGLGYANIAFVGVFTVEAVVKIIGLGFRGYFIMRWNQYDFFLVVVALIGLVTETILRSNNLDFVKSIATFLRVFRIARAGRLVSMFDSLQHLFRTFVMSIPQLGNVLGIILLLIFIYTVFGMHVFANVSRGPFLDDHANFDSFGASLETMFRAATGESYNGIMHDLMVQPPYCSPGNVTHPLDGNCGSPMIAPIFFTSFILVVQFVLLNLLIAIILDQFSENTWISKQDADPRVFKAFKQEWARVDVDRDMAIPSGRVAEVILTTPWPLGLKDRVLSRAEMKKKHRSEKKAKEAAIAHKLRTGEDMVVVATGAGEHGEGTEVETHAAKTRKAELFVARMIEEGDLDENGDGMVTFPELLQSLTIYGALRDQVSHWPQKYRGDGRWNEQ